MSNKDPRNKVNNAKDTSPTPGQGATASSTGSFGSTTAPLKGNIFDDLFMMTPAAFAKKHKVSEKRAEQLMTESMSPAPGGEKGVSAKVNYESIAATFGISAEEVKRQSISSVNLLNSQVSKRYSASSLPDIEFEVDGEKVVMEGNSSDADVRHIKEMLKISNEGIGSPLFKANGKPEKLTVEEIRYARDYEKALMADDDNAFDLKIPESMQHPDAPYLLNERGDKVMGYISSEAAKAEDDAYQIQFRQELIDAETVPSLAISPETGVMTATTLKGRSRVKQIGAHKRKDREDTQNRKLQAQGEEMIDHRKPWGSPAQRRALKKAQEAAARRRKL